jgi:predicted DNA-binding transcriptional regulator YafY
VNRTDRLYALVEELRACAPRSRSARELAALYEVSARTVERDISALQQAGVPIYATAGRRGGYTIDKDRTLPPLNFTAMEAVAVAVALHRAQTGPFEPAARRALQKIMAAMSGRDAEAARDLAGRVRILQPPEPSSPSSPSSPSDVRSVPAVIQEAIAVRKVLRLDYEDRNGVTTQRYVEPALFVAGPRGWYLVGWCRLREDVRVFRMDRVRHATLTDEPAPDRRFTLPAIPALAPHLPQL